MKIPLDNKIKEIKDIPYTISFVIRKRQQMNALNELPSERRPPDLMIWDGSPEELDEWLEEVLSGKRKQTAEFFISNVEG